MLEETLSQPALAIVKKYLELPFSNKKVNCPYFNNSRHKVRGGFRATVGKGLPEEIVEEAIIESLKQKIDLEKLNDEQIKKFLVDNNLGIDCSALAYYILQEELKFKKNKKIIKQIIFPNTKNPFRKLINHLRPAENVSVQILSHPQNSQIIKLSEIKPGDLLIMNETGLDNKINHILIITKIKYQNNQPQNITYLHSFRWRTDGLYDHGVRKGVIEIIDNSENLLNQKWLENEKENNENETYLHAKMAKKLFIKRLKALF